VSADLALAFGRDVVLIDVVSARLSREMRLKDNRRGDIRVEREVRA
jgi:hypothetical protein